MQARLATADEGVMLETDRSGARPRATAELQMEASRVAVKAVRVAAWLAAQRAAWLAVQWAAWLAVQWAVWLVAERAAKRVPLAKAAQTAERTMGGAARLAAGSAAVREPAARRAATAFG